MSDDPSNPPVPSVPGLKRARSLAEKSARRGPRALAPRRRLPNKARAPSGRQKPPRKPAAAAHTNSTGTYKGDARAPAVNARRQRRRPPAARSALQKRRPRLHRRRRVPILRFPRPARERRRGQQWPWPVAGQPRSAGAACTQCRCWRPPSAGLPYFADHRDDARTRRRKALEGQHIGSEILDDTSIHSSEAPPQTLSNGDRNKLSWCSKPNMTIY